MIYLDYNATTPVDPRVLRAMLPYLEEHFGNPSSTHALGATAAKAVATARDRVAVLLGCTPDEVVFTSCATESINTAIQGVAWGLAPAKRHLVTCVVEHPATMNCCRYLADRHGFELTIVPVDSQGRADPDQVRRAIRPDTALVSLMHAQNETGVLQPVHEVGRLAREAGVLFHVDAAQTAGKVPVNVNELGCDLLSIAGHKLYAPKGVGALVVRQGLKLAPLLHGAGYEGGRRGGTLNVPYLVALGEACRIAGEVLGVEGERLRSLRDRLQRNLGPLCPLLNGHPTERLPNTLNVSIPGVNTNQLLARTPGVAASTGSACHAGSDKPSGALLAMGLSPERALSALRLSVGRFTTEDDVDRAASELIAAARSK